MNRGDLYICSLAHVWDTPPTYRHGSILVDKIDTIEIVIVVQDAEQVGRDSQQHAKILTSRGKAGWIHWLPSFTKINR